MSDNRLSPISWLINDYDGMALHPWMGFVRRRELGMEVAPIPLNLLLAWWYWMMDGVRWKFTPKRMRKLHRRALRHAFDRGYDAGWRAACDRHETWR